MKGFIEVTDKKDSLKLCINITQIALAGENNNNRDGMIITTSDDRFATKESYEEIKAKIEEAQKGE